MVCVSTVLNTLRSWAQAGLLDMVQEKIALFSDPTPEEVLFCYCCDVMFCFVVTLLLIYDILFYVLICCEFS